MRNVPTQIGPYAIERKIGEGGMGVVYLGRDTKLGRPVAIKALPLTLADDPRYLGRFEREAKILASLNHPNVTAIYGLEEVDGAQFLIMEYVEGSSLADRVAAGPVPVREALAICAEIAAGVRAAHEAGIIHRDLKPGNIHITPDRKVKILDFGVAKITEPDAATPLVPHREPVYQTTQAGLVLGTASYMSPEQICGKPLDKRTDIWTFGCILYELLTGRRAFSGDSTFEIQSAVMNREPDWHPLPPTTPPAIRTLLLFCLQKDLSRRLEDLGDARNEIERALDQPAETSAPADTPQPPPPDTTSPPEPAAPTEPSTTTLPWRRRWRSRSRLPALVLIAAVATVLGWLAPRSPPPMPKRLVRLSAPIPSDQQLVLGARSYPLALSPDATTLVYVAESEGRTRLYRRPLDDFQAVPFAGTEGARQPFFSPDGRWVGFFTDRALFKVPLSGGRPERICTIPAPGFGASWGAGDTIVFATVGRGLFKLAGEVATPETLTTLDAATGELAHRWPQILPDRKNVLFTVSSTTGSHIAVASLETGDQRVVAADLNGVVQARYLDPGYLLYSKAGTLEAAPFDLQRLALRGTPVRVRNRIYEAPSAGAVYFTVSENGSLAFVPGGTEHLLVRVDRQGGATPLIAKRDSFRYPSLSPDGQRLAVTIDDEPRPSNIWVYNLNTGSRTRITSRGYNLLPVWTPDGERITFYRDGDIYWKLADGTGEAQRLLTGKTTLVPRSWAPDGSALFFTEQNTFAESDVWVLSLDPEMAALPIINTSANEYSPRLSPNGRWLAYVSDESGRAGIYVLAYPELDRRWRLSPALGEEPRWSATGRELFYRSGDKIMVVNISEEPQFTPSEPQVLFRGRYDVRHSSNYDVSPDGRYFVMIKIDPEAPPTRFDVELNWIEELKTANL